MNRFRFLVLYAAPWSVFGLLYTILLLIGGDTSVLGAIADSIWSLALPCALGLVVWRICTKLPWPSQQPRKFFAIHMGLALAYTCGWSATTVFRMTRSGPPAVVAAFLKRALTWELLEGVLVYGAIAGVCYLLQIDRRLEAQRQLAARAQLQALRARLNPHFLFNTLHSITSIVRKDPTAGEDALVRLGALLRYVLEAGDRPSDDVTFEEELQFARSYLALEQLRLGARLQVVEDIDPDVLECVMPALTLQPLLENAVRHGLAPRARGGTVTLRATLAGDRVSLVVSDDGVGASPESVPGTGGRGLGLVRQRLALRFGREDALQIVTSIAGGFCARVDIPAVTGAPSAERVAMRWTLGSAASTGSAA